MGHEGYLSGSYRRYSVEQLKAEYDKASYLVSLYGSENLPAIKADLQSQREVVQSVVNENIMLKRRLDDIQAVIDELAKK